MIIFPQYIIFVSCAFFEIKVEKQKFKIQFTFMRQLS